MKHYFTLLLVATCMAASAQKQGNIWYFGEQLGLDFSSGTPVEITGGQTTSLMGIGVQGTTSISDSAGHLLFYATGEQVWNRNHQVMPNGGGLLSCSSSTQAVLAVPMPGSNNIYYLFTTQGHDCTFNPLKGAFRYNIIDMCLNNGMGDIIPGRKNILLFDTSMEKIAACEDAPGTGYWVLARKMGTDAFYAYHLATTGLNTTPVISHIDTVNGTISYWPFTTGQMKLSPDGHKVALVKDLGDGGAAVGLFDFNNATGAVTNLRRLVLDIDSQQKGCLGLEFSPDNTKLYAPSAGGSGEDHIYQYDITAGGGTEAAINASKYAVFTSIDQGELGTTQAGPDGKIYLVRGNSPHLNFITNPNLSGAACQFDSLAAFVTHNTATYPSFIAGFKYHTGLSFCMQAGATRNCADSCGATASAVGLNGQPPYTYHWAPGNDTTQVLPNLCPGIYTATVTDAAGGTVSDTIVILPLPQPGNINLNPADSLFCANDSVLICAPTGYSGYVWNNGATGACTYAHLAGNYYVTVTDFSNCSAQSNPVAVGIYPGSSVAISVNGDTLHAYSSNSYQWYFNGAPIDSATASIYVAHQPGNYQVAVTDSNGCTATSNPIVFSGINYLTTDAVQLLPNPFTNRLTISLSGTITGTTISITDILGKKIWEQAITQPTLQLNTTNIANGIYFITISNGNQKIVKQLVKQ